jgi:RNA polymerase sigma factor (sigma-70 family)
MPGDSAGDATPSRAVADLLATFIPLIHRAAARVASRRAAPLQDDIVQVVTTAVWRQLERGQCIEQPASYVYKAVVRETVRALKREQERAEVPIDTTEADALAGKADTHADLEIRELGDAIQECVGTLSQDRARAVRAHLAGLDVAELMTMYGWTYQRARNLVARGMADLRDALRARGVEP